MENNWTCSCWWHTKHSGNPFSCNQMNEDEEKRGRQRKKLWLWTHLHANLKPKSSDINNDEGGKRLQNM